MKNKIDKNRIIFYALSDLKRTKNGRGKTRRIKEMIPVGQIHKEAAQQYNYPIYYPAEVSRLVKISTPRVHRWLIGYEYDYASERIKQPPVVKRKWDDNDHRNYASFYDLVDLLFVKHFLKYGISLQKLRKAFKEAEDIIGTPHFVHQNFFTDGKKICLKVKDTGGAILELLSNGQWVISEIIAQLAHQVDFDSATKFACRWFPPEGDHLVVLDPWISFGRPAIFKKGVMTENIYGFYIAEGKKEQSVCNWMGLERKEVLAAVKFEEHLAS